MGHTIYPTIFSIIKTALTLVHGYAEIESGFSDSGKTVTVERIRLSEASVINLRIATDELKVFAVCHNIF